MVSFKDLSEKRKGVVREKIANLWVDGFSASEISKKVRISHRSVAATVGHFERLVRQPVAKRSSQKK